MTGVIPLRKEGCSDEPLFREYENSEIRHPSLAYDYEIAAADGSILKKDFEVEDHGYHGGSAPQTGISQEQAEEIALQRVPGAQAEQTQRNVHREVR